MGAYSKEIAHNEKINADADAACLAYYAENPEGNWEEAHKIAEDIRAAIVSIPRGGYAVYPR